MEDIALCNRFAFEASFIEESKKQRIWNKYFKETLNPN
jgi:adenosine deaminase